MEEEEKEKTFVILIIRSKFHHVYLDRDPVFI